MPRGTMFDGSIAQEFAGTARFSSACKEGSTRPTSSIAVVSSGPCEACAQAEVV
jgi:hypothetical protein